MNNLEKIIKEIIVERHNQEIKWGEQNHPILDQTLIDREPKRMCDEYEILSEIRAKQLVDIHVDRGTLTYMHIFLEEICEAVSCGSNIEELRKELIQSTAVLIAMVESLDRNGR